MLGKRLLLVLLLPYVVWLTLSYEYHFIDGVNLAFHEAGHLFLTPFGRTLHVLGGTFGQLFVPAACAAHFLRRGSFFEAAICGIWAGESTMYMARYLGDAKDMMLPLVGGHIHDWNWLLAKAGLLDECRALAAFAHGVATATVLVCFGLAARLVLSPGAPPSCTEGPLNE